MATVNVDFQELLSSLFDLDALYQPADPSPNSQATYRTITTDHNVPLQEQGSMAHQPAVYPTPSSTSQGTGHTKGDKPVTKRGRPKGGGSAKSQISELETQLTKKLAELKVLEDQNLLLKDKGRVLEIVIRARDEQVERLKQLREMFQALQHRPPGISPQTSMSTPSPPLAPVPRSFSQGSNPNSNDSDTRSSAISGVDQSNHFDSQPQQHQQTVDIRHLNNQGSGADRGEVSHTSRLTEGHILQPLDPAILVAYTNLSVEQLMANHQNVIAKLTSELMKPGQGKLMEMMHNLREFARHMALLSDKFQLMVSRDVTAVPACPAVLDTGVLEHAFSSSGTGSSSPLRRVSGSLSGIPAAAAAATVAGGLPGAPLSGDLAATEVPLADAAAVMAASLVPTLGSAELGTGELVISDNVPHTGLVEVVEERSSRGDDAKEGTTDKGGKSAKLLLESLQAAAQDPELLAHWSQVVVALHLSPRQKADTRALWELYQGWRKKLDLERQRLSTMLDEVLRKSKYGAVYLGDGSAAGSLSEAQVLKRLHKNVQAEHAMLMVLGEVFQYQLLDLEQAAKLLIQSWPYIPDTVSVMYAAVHSEAATATNTT